MTESLYALYPVFKAQAAFRDLDADDAAQEIENLFKEWEGRIAVRGVYSTVGFRADSDLMLWLIGSSPDEMQGALVQFRRTVAGRLLDPVWMFMGVVKPAEFTSDHSPAFARGDPPKRFLNVYPRSARACSENTASGAVGSPTSWPTPPARSASTTGSGSWPSRPTTWGASWSASERSASRRPGGTPRRRSRSSPASERTSVKSSPTSRSA